MKSKTSLLAPMPCVSHVGAPYPSSRPSSHLVQSRGGIQALTPKRIVTTTTMRGRIDFTIEREMIVHMILHPKTSQGTGVPSRSRLLVPRITLQASSNLHIPPGHHRLSCRGDQILLGRVETSSLDTRLILLCPSPYQGGLLGLDSRSSKCHTNLFNLHSNQATLSSR